MVTLGKTKTQIRGVIGNIPDFGSGDFKVRPLADLLFCYVGKGLS
jgi:hypothetical protein